jgi:hypothetical protein
MAALCCNTCCAIDGALIIMQHVFVDRRGVAWLHCRIGRLLLAPSGSCFCHDALVWLQELFLILFPIRSLNPHWLQAWWS